MGYRILILDDDQEFNNLLTDVYEQADYTVEAALNVQSALEELNKNEFDLIVTDQRLPKDSGLEFIKKVRQENRQIPIIMVSGYLDNETIRELIRSGVNGIFIKPLNIFSLLKKSSELIELSKARRGGNGSSVGGANGDGALSAFPCVSSRAREFAERARGLSGFSRNLLLIGPAGMPYDVICGDIVRLGGKKDLLILLSAGEVSEQLILERVQSQLANQPEIERITLAVMQGDQLNSDEINLMTRCVANQGAFDVIERPVRLIVCLRQTVEDLYDQELIDEDFYMFLGSNELHVPALREMTDEISALAERELKSISSTWELDSQTKSLLQRQTWENNWMQLREVVLQAVSIARQNMPTINHFEAALSGEVHEVEDALLDYLNEEKSAFLRARNLLSTE